jgi:hypothetical protein
MKSAWSYLYHKKVANGPEKSGGVVIGGYGRYHNGNFYSPLDESLVDWSVVPETATFDGATASGYITQFSVVPEPATLALIALGGVILGRRRRQVRRPFNRVGA